MSKALPLINDIELLVTDHIEAMLAYWDKDEICRFANNAYRDWFGKSKEEMVDKITLKELLGPIYDKNEFYIKEALAGKVQQFERDILTPNGELKHSLANYYPDIHEGKVRGFIVHVTDITKQKKAEDKYNILFNSIDEAFCIIEVIFNEKKEAVDYRFLEVNSSFERQTGLKNAQGKRMRELSPEHEQYWFDTYATIALTGESSRFENRAEQLKRWFDVYAFRWGDPKNLQVAIIFNDISNRKKSEEQLKESEDKFRSLFNFSPLGVVLSNAEGKLLDANPAILDMMGLASLEELTTKPAQDYYVEPEERTRMFNLLRKDGFVKGFEFKVKKQNGEYVWISNNMRPFQFGNKQRQLISAAVDITKRKNIEEQLEEANKELESFSYCVAHDLRAPLRSIHGYAEMLNEDYENILDDEGKRIIGNIKYNASKMGRLIDDLLSFSRLGRKEIIKNKVSMNAVANEVIAEINKTISHKAEFVLDDLPDVQGDYSLLYQVMINLISNAVKYSSKKEKPLIHIFSKEINGEMVISIKDNGAGFDMLYAYKLFGVFQRLHNERDFEGTGIGLALVNRIITRHGGRVWAEGQVDSGATFNFTLPNN